MCQTRKDQVLASSSIDAPLEMFVTVRSSLHDVGVHKMQVTALELINISPTPRQMLDIASFKHLRALHIDGQRLCADISIEDSSFKLLGQLAMLESLSLQWLSHVSEEGLIEGLCNLERLTSLVLVDVTKVQISSNFL